jgi:CRP-like cAMP-binding protein
MEQTIAIVGKGDFFGETAVVDKYHRAVSARAEVDCDLLHLDTSTFAELIHGDFALKIVANLIQKLSDSRSLLEGSSPGRQPVPSDIRSCILSAQTRPTQWQRDRPQGIARHVPA